MPDVIGPGGPPQNGGAGMFDKWIPVIVGLLGFGQTIAGLIMGKKRRASSRRRRRNNEAETLPSDLGPERRDRVEKPPLG